MTDQNTPSEGSESSEAPLFETGLGRDHPTKDQDLLAEMEPASEETPPEPEPQVDVADLQRQLQEYKDKYENPAVQEARAALS